MLSNNRINKTHHIIIDNPKSEDLTMQSIGTQGYLIEIGIFTLIIKDRRFNLFNMS